MGFVGSMLYRGLPQHLRDFQASFPGIQVALTELNSQEQIDALLHDELDAGFVHTGRLPDELSAVLVHSEPFVCCLPQEHALAAQPEVALADLRAEPFVLFSRKASPDYYSRIFDMCAAQGFYPQIRHEVRHWLSVVSLVSQGMGVAVVPAALARRGWPGRRSGHWRMRRCPPRSTVRGKPRRITQHATILWRWCDRLRLQRPTRSDNSGPTKKKPPAQGWWLMKYAWNGVFSVSAAYLPRSSLTNNTNVVIEAGMRRRNDCPSRQARCVACLQHDATQELAGAVAEGAPLPLRTCGAGPGRRYCPG